MLVVTLRTAPGSAMPLITFERARSVYNVASIFHLGPDARKLYKLERQRKFDVRAAGYSMTSSARASSAGGIVMPSVFAVFRLMISSKRVGCSTGRSPGLAPFKILFIISAA